MARPAIKKLNIIEIEYVAHRLAQELMEYGEPIPPFDTRYPDKLESCLKTPFQTFHRKGLYPTFETKAAILLYLMIKNHPFQNGNKRVAILTLIYFLIQNGRRLKVDNKILYELSKEIAAGDAKNMDTAVANIRKFIVQYSEKKTEGIK
jgi:death-on-curing family protein